MPEGIYSRRVMELFRHPKNIGELKDPDGVGRVGNPMCGDVMWVYIRAGRGKSGQETIRDIRVKTFGCAAAIAASSQITEMAKGKTLEEAMKISKDDVVNLLGGLPPQKIHCTMLAINSLHNAIEDCRKRKGTL